MDRWNRVTTALLLAGAVVAVAAMSHGAGQLSWNWFYPWVLMPYFLLFACFCLLRNPSLARARAGAVGSALVLVFTAVFYVDAMWFSKSSTSALVFVFTPLLLTVGGLVAWALVWWILSRFNVKPNGR